MFNKYTEKLLFSINSHIELWQIQRALYSFFTILCINIFIYELCRNLQWAKWIFSSSQNSSFNFNVKKIKAQAVRSPKLLAFFVIAYILADCFEHEIPEDVTPFKPHLYSSCIGMQISWQWPDTGLYDGFTKGHGHFISVCQFWFWHCC